MAENRDYERWRDLNVASMRAFFSLMPAWAPDGELVERDGLMASVAPGVPYFSLFNSVIYWDANALADSLGELANIYEEAGIKAWTVWVPDRDRQTAGVLEAAGHALDSTPRMMGRELDDLEPHSMEGIDWTSQGSPADVCPINDEAYGLPEGSFQKGCGLPRPEDCGIYVAKLDGKAVSCVLTLDVGGDLGIYAVATAPEAQGHGLSSALMRQVMADGRDRGLKTTCLQASAAGRPIYERVGYGDFGWFEMWERREPDPE